MRSISMIRFFALFSVLFLCAPDAGALLYLDADQGASGIELEFDILDDDNDNDQSFPPDAAREIIKIKNGSRRYLAIYIDRIIASVSNEAIDNGPNDYMIGPSTPVFQLETLHNYWACLYYGDVDCEPPPATRNYILPVPGDTLPGTEVRFRIQALGPRLGGTVPFTYTDPKFEGLLESSARTSFEILLLPLVSTVAGRAVPKDWDQKIQLLFKDFLSFAKSEPAFLQAFEQKSITNIVRETWNYALGSSVLKDIFIDLGYPDVSAALGAIDDTLSSGIIEGTETLNVLIHLLDSEWMEEFNVIVAIPQLLEVSPASGEPGDEITLYGNGFDPYTPTNNRVFFTTLNDQGAPVPTAEATILEVPYEDTMRVRVPGNFVSGPVMVCTSGYCSNWDVEFTDPVPYDPQFTLTSPQEGETLSGQIEVTGEIMNPPDSFEASASLVVDGVPVDSANVTAPAMSFSLDLSTLAEGIHSIGISVEIEGKTVSSSASVMVEAEEPGVGDTFVIDPEAACFFDADNPYAQYKTSFYVDWQDHSERLDVSLQMPSCDGYALIDNGTPYYYGFNIDAVLEKYYPEYDEYYSQCHNGMSAMQGTTARFYADASTGGYLMGESYVNGSQDYYSTCTDPYLVEYSYAPYTGNAGGCWPEHYTRSTRIRFEVSRGFTRCAP